MSARSKKTDKSVEAAKPVVLPDLTASEYGPLVLPTKPNANPLEAEYGPETKKPERKSVVGYKYKARYRAAGNYRGCGDWLHQELELRTVDGFGKLDLPAFEAICEENGVSLEKYNRTSNGWQGRLRMTGRILLRSKILKSGSLLVEGEKLEAPREWIAAQQR